MRAPLELETANEECLCEACDGGDVRDIGSVNLPKPLGIMIPHRVRSFAYQAIDCFQLKCVAFREKDKIRSKASGASYHPVLRQATSH